jgi:hypothetical protein
LIAAGARTKRSDLTSAITRLKSSMCFTMSTCLTQDARSGVTSGDEELRLSGHARARSAVVGVGPACSRAADRAVRAA